MLSQWHIDCSGRAGNLGATKLKKQTLQFLFIALLLGGFLSACTSGGNAAADCTINGAVIAAGDKIPTDECGGCVCTNEGQVQCIQEDCTPQSTYDSQEPVGGWGVSEYYCCCKSGCPPGSNGCLTACLVFGGGVCGNFGSHMLLACQGSSPLNGCTCASDNESTVAPL
jgi:hypothetical protein